MSFLKDTATPRITDGNISDESDIQQRNSDVSDSEEINSFVDNSNDVQSPENSVFVSESNQPFIIPSVSNILHPTTPANISNDSDTSAASTISSAKRKKKPENKNFENEILKLEAQKLNAFLESNKTHDDEDMMFLKSLHPYFKNMNTLQKLKVRNQIQSVFINELSTNEPQQPASYVPSTPLHEPYISHQNHHQNPHHNPLQNPPQIPTNSLGHTDFEMGYHQHY